MQRYDVLDAYVQACLPILGLEAWRVAIVREALGPDEDTAAVIHNHLRNEAEIKVSDDFWGFDPERKRQVVAHELGHLHDARQRDLVGDLEAVLPRAVWKLFDRQYDRANEVRMEALEPILARLLPEWSDAA